MRGTPVPIPNTTVKTHTADGTALETVWESRWPPESMNTKAKERGRSLRETGRRSREYESRVDKWAHLRIEGRRKQKRPITAKAGCTLKTAYMIRSCRTYRNICTQRRRKTLRGASKEAETGDCRS